MVRERFVVVGKACRSGGVVKFGNECFFDDPQWIERLRGRRVGIVGHPASVDHTLTHTLTRLAAHGDVNVTAAFGPQHGIMGDKQDNMIETMDCFDDDLGIPIFSLYGSVRRPTALMLDTVDVVIFDVQDLGTRVYTFLTTLLYILEASAKSNKEVWVLDRPNPAGRMVDGMTLALGHESFVGAADLPMRHGLTMGEAAIWFVRRFNIDVALTVVPMVDYDPTGDGFGWPSELTWVNPSPNAASLNMARCYPGTVVLEGTTLSEGRGTTIPLEVLGAPDLPMDRVLTVAQELAPEWMEGAIVRPCWFEPTFHKHVGTLCHGLQIHADYSGYVASKFHPYRMIAVLLKAIRQVAPEYEIWRNHPYEYAQERLPIDVIDGGDTLRRFVDEAPFTVADFDALLIADAASWRSERASSLLYPDDWAPN